MIKYSLGIICGLAIVIIVLLLGWLRVLTEELDKERIKNEKLKNKISTLNKNMEERK